METIKAIFMSWLCLAMADPKDLTKKEHRFFTVGAVFLAGLAFVVAILGTAVINAVLVR